MLVDSSSESSRRVEQTVDQSHDSSNSYEFKVLASSLAGVRHRHDKDSLPPMSMPIFTASELAMIVIFTSRTWWAIRLSVQCGPRRCADGGIGGILATVES